MTWVIVCFVLLLLSLIEFHWQGAQSGEFSFNGTAGGVMVLAIVIIVMLRRVLRSIRTVSEKAGLPRKLPTTRYDVLPWLFLLPWLIGLRFTGGVVGSPEGKWHLSWEFNWGQNLLKLLIMLGLVLTLYLLRLNRRLAEIGESTPGNVT